MDFNLKSKTALITGSSKGIGWKIAKSLQTEGCRVVLNGRDLQALNVAMLQLPDSLGIVGDVTHLEVARKVVTEVVATLGHLDILVCNVGSGRSVPPGEETAEEWQRVFALNLWSTTNMVEAASDALVQSKGVIVCISSICGLEVISGAPLTYSVAKAALHAYVRGIARPLGKQGVRINAIASGNILFDGSVWSRKLQENSQVVYNMLQNDVALGCLGSPKDIAHLVCYLVSSYSEFVTGAVWTLDGGQVVRG